MKVQFDTIHNNAIITLPGHIDSKTIIHALHEVTRDTRYHEGMHRIWDFREANLSGATFQSMQKSAADNAQAAAEILNVKVALVVGSELDFAICRQFESIRELEIASPIKTFLSLEEAQRWIASDQTG